MCAQEMSNSSTLHIFKCIICYAIIISAKQDNIKAKTCPYSVQQGVVYSQ